MMKCFIAMDLNSLKEDLLSLQEQLPDEGLKKVNDFHLTLRFLGEVQDPDPIIEKLKQVSFTPFKAEIGGIGAFPSLRSPKVIYVGAHAPQFSGLVQRIDNALGIDKKRFSAHITLARVKFIKNRDRLMDRVRGMVYSKRIDIGSYSFLKSTLTPKGPIYEELWRASDGRSRIWS
jgi:2'-5' RNA ligase